MAIPIKETPVLTGREAAKFISKMVRAETRPASKKERIQYSRAKKLYDRMKLENKHWF